MESSLSIKQEYFELINKLNQTNRLENQRTEVSFYIDSTNVNHSKLFAAISESQKILLCEKIEASPWRQSNITEFPELAEFLTKLLNSVKNKNDLTTLIKSHIFKYE